MRNHIYRHSKFPHSSDKRDFFYLDAKNKKISKLDAKTEKYVQNLKIPPAYHPVKISLSPNSKILAIGVDKKGKDQYIYNPKWVDKRHKQKYCELKKFAHQLPKIKRKIQRHLSEPRMTEAKMIAAILQIILSCHFRVGNDIGRDMYNSYGISTITKKQIDTRGKNVKIEFIGKRGVRNFCTVKDKKVNQILRDLEKKQRVGDPLFSIKSQATGNKRRITAKDVNGFLKEYGDFTTKYFRTWVANVEFIDEIMERYRVGGKLSETARKKLLRDSIVATAEKLYHTPAICKKSYVSGDLWDMFIDKPRKFDEVVAKNYKKNSKNGGLDSSENAFLHFLEYTCK